MNMKENWYWINGLADVDSPALLLYEDRLEHNIALMIQMVGGQAERLMPHIKTNKSSAVVHKMRSEGIDRFKTSTLVESRLAAHCGAKAVLLAHQLVGPKITGLVDLMSSYPETTFSTLVDNEITAKELDRVVGNAGQRIGVYIDVNSGMDRSGIRPGDSMEGLIATLNSLPNLEWKGLHAYDGHLRQPEFTDRKRRAEAEMEPVELLLEKHRETRPELELVVGGTPSFSVHCDAPQRICSPGTCVFWDWGYGDLLQEQEFNYAVAVLCRVISKPKQGVLTTDLGHKAIAPEQAMDKRIRFLNAPDARLVAQSEEHGLVEVDDDSNFKVGDVLLGIPHHVCPTINLYDRLHVVRSGEVVQQWEVDGRKRTLSI